MKTVQLIVILLSLIIFSTSCDKDKRIKRAKGEVTKVEKNVTEFTALDVHDAFDVDVTYSTEEELVVVEAEDNIQEIIIVEVQNDILVIKLKNGVNLRGNPTLKIHITTAELNDFEASDACDIKLNNTLTANDIRVKLSDACNFVGTIEATMGELDLSDASNANITGTIESLNVLANDASSIEDYDLQCNTLDANLSDASNLKITVNDELRVTASDASSVKYKGTGVVMFQDLSDASTLIKKD